MSRVVGPRESQRAITTFDTGKQTSKGYPNQKITFYTNEAATQLADIRAYDAGYPTTPGAVIAGSVMTLDKASRVEPFWFPDGITTLYGKLGRARTVIRVTAEPTAASVEVLAGRGGAKLDRGVAFRGINLAGAAFGSWDNANVNPTNWRWPFEQEWQYLASRGHKLVRLPYMWERLQPDLALPNNATQMAELDKQIGYAAKYGLKVVLSNHNYASYKGVKFAAGGGPTQAQFVAHWVEMANRYKDNDTVVGLGLMNEPQSIPTADLTDGAGSLTGQLRWYRLAQAAVTAIRATGDTTPIMVSGYAVGVVASWLSNTAQVGNKKIHEYVVDPLDNLFFEGHMYFDNGGTYPNDYANYNTNSGQSDSAAVDGLTKAQLGSLRAWLDWAEEKNVRLFLGEFGWPRVKTGHNQADVDKWNALGNEVLKLIDSYGARVWTTAWAAGSKWADTYELRYYYSSAGDANVLETPAENAVALELHKTFAAPPPARRPRGMTTPKMNLQWRGQNVPIEYCSGTGAMVTGQEYGTVVAVDTPGFISRINVYVNTVGVGNVAAQCLAAVYDIDTGEVLAVTDDIGAQFLSLGYRNLDLLTRTKVFQVGELVGVKLLWNGTTPPVLTKAPIAASAAPTRKYGVVSTGATALTATLPIASMTAPTQPFWVAVAGY